MGRYLLKVKMFFFFVKVKNRTVFRIPHFKQSFLSNILAPSAIQTQVTYSALQIDYLLKNATTAFRPGHRKTPSCLTPFKFFLVETRTALTYKQGLNSIPIFFGIISLPYNPLTLRLCVFDPVIRRVLVGL